MNYEGKNVLVIGMSSSGISASYLLTELGANVSYYDDNLSVNVAQFVNVTQLPKEKIIRNLDCIVVSPSIGEKHELLRLAKENNIPVISELELGSSLLDCKKIVVTGTNGKTTVVGMLEKLLINAGKRAKAMGNVGYPVSQVVLDKTELDYAIIEASSFQLEHIDSLRADIAVILNLAPDHLDRYDSYSDYVNAKKNIIRNQMPNDYIFVNDDDAATKQFADESKAQPFYISTKKTDMDVYIKDNYFMLGDVSLCHVKECKLRGEHNKFNLLVTLNIGNLVGAKKEHLYNLIKEYSLLPNRIEYVTTINGKSYYNDSKGTNIHATKFAINSIEGDIGLIMGGSDKNEDFCEFFEEIDSRVKTVVVCGGNAKKILSSALKMGFNNITEVEDLADAINRLSKNEEICNILFSPSSASFDRFKNYAERGEKFRQLVYAIEN